MKTNQAAKCVRWCWKSFCFVFFCKKHVFRDVIIIIFLMAGIGSILAVNWRQQKEIKNKISTVSAVEPVLPENEAVQQEEQKVPEIQAQFDTSGWTPYQNTWYGLALKYPNDWADPIIRESRSCYSITPAEGTRVHFR